MSVTGTRPRVEAPLEALEAFFSTEVIRGERIVAWTRLVLAVTGLGNEVYIGKFPGTAGATVDSTLTTTGLALAFAYSLFTLLTLKRAGKTTELRLFLSVTVDAILICLVTCGDIVQPDPNYHGLLRETSVGLFFLAAMAAGVRLSGRVAIGGSIMLLLVGIGMVIADTTLQPDYVRYGEEEIILCLILLLGSTLLGYTGASRTRNLVFRGANFAVEAERTRQRFGVYVSKEVADQVLKDDETKKGGRRQPVAVLFCDLRGFTRYAEKTPPEQLVTELNDYLDAMLAVVREEGGWLDKYIGDAMMVVFGVGSPRADDASRAIRTAAGMRTALMRHNEERKRKGKPPFAHGIGVHHGSAIVGNIGTEDRLQFTVVGDVVNLASRLEAATKQVQVPVLISSVAAHVARGAPGKGLPALREVGNHELPGRSGSFDLYTLESESRAATYDPGFEDETSGDFKPIHSR
ncbi:MAG: adenylate/guanylate cyclase domain-containing protein [Deltaproteobacteria bacterium]|nr:adenylate/guanylate cyclase domain-containing protein [Deltaproteobacteria bacterium]